MSFTSYSVDNDNKFRNALTALGKQFDDLRIPLTQISMDFYNGERAIFKLKSPGQYDDLAESTKKKRIKDGQPFYPILVKSGTLARSLLGKGNPGNITVITKNTLTIGTTVEHGIYHQSDKHREKIPLRKFLFIGPESIKYAGMTKETAGRLTRWMTYLENFAISKARQSGAFE